MNYHDGGATLEQFLDGSLGAVERWAVIAHMDECAACRRFAADEARLRGRLREQIVATEAAPGLVGRLQAALASVPDGAPRSPLLAFPLSAGVRLAMVLGPALAALWLLVQISVPQAGASLDLPRDLAASHALFAQDESLLDVVGDAEAVSSWFHTTVGLTIAAPAIEGYSLMGARLIVVNGSPVAQLVYETEDDHYLSLLNYRGAGDPSVLTVTQRGTISTATWPVDGERVALIGDMPETALLHLAESLAGWPAAAVAASS